MQIKLAVRGKSNYGEYDIPEEMTQEQINQVIEEFYQGAVRAKEAGFDGVELHGANGYLVDQFLRSSTNKRNDHYGGSIENRCRFALEVIDQLIKVFGDRVAIKVSPLGRFNDMFDEDPEGLYRHLFNELSKRTISFIELLNNNDPENSENYGYISSRAQVPDLYKQLRKSFNGILIGNGELTKEIANEGIQNGDFDAASFATLFIGNPDLVERMRNNLPLQQPDWNLLFTPGAKGYTDYQAYESK